MIELHFNPDTSPTPPLIFTAGSNILRFGLILDCEALLPKQSNKRPQHRPEEHHWGSQC